MRSNNVLNMHIDCDYWFYRVYLWEYLSSSLRLWQMGILMCYWLHLTEGLCRGTCSSLKWPLCACVHACVIFTALYTQASLRYVVASIFFSPFQLAAAKHELLDSEELLHHAVNVNKTVASTTIHLQHFCMFCVTMIREVSSYEFLRHKSANGTRFTVKFYSRWISGYGINFSESNSKYLQQSSQVSKKLLQTEKECKMWCDNCWFCIHKFLIDPFPQSFARIRTLNANYTLVKIQASL